MPSAFLLAEGVPRIRVLRYAQLSAMTLLTSKAFRERVLKAGLGVSLGQSTLELTRLPLAGTGGDSHISEGPALMIQWEDLVAV